MTQPANTFQALIFDLDGTLIDSAPDCRASINRVLAELGRRKLTLEETKDMVGWGGRVLVESGVSDKAMEGLRAMGHRVQRSVGSFGGYQGILVDRESGVYHAASDNRKDGCAVGY